MLESRLMQRLLGAFLLIFGGFLLYDVWSRGLAGQKFTTEEGVYAPLFVVAGVVVLLGRLDLAARKAEYEANRWFWQWKLAAWVEVAIGLGLALAHLALLNWVTGSIGTP